MYPKLEAEFGNSVTYVQSPKSHVLVEFAFDVVQVAAGAYAPEAYHSYIGFKVAKPALERAFRETYGLEMKDVFLNEDLAIATYRHAVGTTIPEMTKVAWGKKRDEIMKVTPGCKRKTFVFNLSRRQYDKEFGRRLREAARVRAVHRPGLRPAAEDWSVPVARVLGAHGRSRATVPGEFHESERALRPVAGTRCETAGCSLPNTDFDTGQPTARGEYPLADATYDQLLDALAGRGFAERLAHAERKHRRLLCGPCPADHSQPRSTRRTPRRFSRQVALLEAACACR